MARPAQIAPALLRLMKVKDAPHAWTLGEMCRQLGKRRLACAPSTVFRAVNRLVEEGVLTRVPNPVGRSPLYEITASHHDHLLCRSCRRLVPVPCPLGPEVPENLESTSGHRIDGHELVLDGLCSRCRARRERDTRSPSSSPHEEPHRS
jgi:Fe2+ or Zn2+ uptake regulation protein